MLPDSTINEAASHGFVKFKIHPISAFDKGDVIPNQASIYFDFNEPIQTNLLALEIEPANAVTSTLLSGNQHLTVFPQPANSTVNFRFLKEELFHRGNFSLEVFNTNGQLILVKSVDQTFFQINGLKEGIYFYRLLNAKMPKEGGKFIIVND